MKKNPQGGCGESPEGICVSLQRKLSSRRNCNCPKILAPVTPRQVGAGCSVLCLSIEADYPGNSRVLIQVKCLGDVADGGREPSNGRCQPTTETRAAILHIPYTPSSKVGKAGPLVAPQQQKQPSPYTIPKRTVRVTPPRVTLDPKSVVGH